MGIVIGIFDDDASLEEAVEALQEFGLDEAAFTILGGADREDAPLPGAGPAVLPGTAPGARHAGVSVSADAPPGETAVAVQEALGDRVHNATQLEHYASVLAHDGRLLAVNTAGDETSRVAEALSTLGAVQVDSGED